MELKEQVCSLELAKKLKQLGVKQESIFWWGGISNMGIWCDHVKNELPEKEKRFVWYSAFTVAELGEMLPPFVTSEKQLGVAGGWFCHLDSNPLNLPMIKNPHRHEIDADTEANARARMLVYLLENKLINL